MLAERGGGLGDLAVDRQVYEVLALGADELTRHEAELYRGLLDALGEVALVEREPELAVLEDVVRARLVVSSSRGVHTGMPRELRSRASPSGRMRRHSKQDSFSRMASATAIA